MEPTENSAIKKPTIIFFSLLVTGMLAFFIVLTFMPRQWLKDNKDAKVTKTGVEYIVNNKDSEYRVVYAHKPQAHGVVIAKTIERNGITHEGHTLFLSLENNNDVIGFTQGVYMLLPQEYYTALNKTLKEAENVYRGATPEAGASMFTLHVDAKPTFSSSRGHLYINPTASSEEFARLLLNEQQVSRLPAKNYFIFEAERSAFLPKPQELGKTLDKPNAQRQAQLNLMARSCENAFTIASFNKSLDGRGRGVYSVVCELDKTGTKATRILNDLIEHNEYITDEDSLIFSVNVPAILSQGWKNYQTGQAIAKPADNRVSICFVVYPTIMGYFVQSLPLEERDAYQKEFVTTDAYWGNYYWQVNTPDPAILNPNTKGNNFICTKKSPLSAYTPVSVFIKIPKSQTLQKMPGSDTKQYGVKIVVAPENVEDAQMDNMYVYNNYASFAPLWSEKFAISLK